MPSTRLIVPVVVPVQPLDTSPIGADTRLPDRARIVLAPGGMSRLNIPSLVVV
jgi:hypothetical protein